MAQLITIILSLASVVWVFFSPRWAWAPILVATGFLLLALFSLKRRAWRHVDELSPDANELLQKFGHYYAMPFAGRDFSAAASTLQFAAIAVGIMGAVKGFWIGLVITVILWLVLGPVAMAFNPSNFLKDPLQQLAHQEIIEWITSRNGRTSQ